MVKIYIKGLLGEKFTKEFEAEIKTPKEAIFALEANFKGFRKELTRLVLNDCHYSIIVNGEKNYSCLDTTPRNNIKTIHIVPIITGAGVGMFIMGILLHGATDTILATIGAGLIDAVLMMTVSMAASAILGPKTNQTQDNSVETSATGGSFMFSSKENTARQGIPVPIGYGMIMAGSIVIQSNIRSFPQNRNPKNIYGPINSSNNSGATIST